MSRIGFIVHGEPVSKGRPRMMKSGHVYTPRKTVDYEKLVVAEYKKQVGNFKFEDDSHLYAEIKACFAIPQSASKARQKQMEEGFIRPVKKPDLDNCIKSILDALNGIAYKDDVQIIHVEADKWYSHNPRVEVILYD